MFLSIKRSHFIFWLNTVKGVWNLWQCFKKKNLCPQYQMERVVVRCGHLCVRSYLRICVKRTTLLWSCRSRKLSWPRRSPCCPRYTPVCKWISVRNTHWINNIEFKFMGGSIVCLRFAIISQFRDQRLFIHHRCRIIRKSYSHSAVQRWIPSEPDSWKLRIGRETERRRETSGRCSAQSFSRNHSGVPLSRPYGTD